MTSENYVVLSLIFAAFTAIATLINAKYVKSQIEKDHAWRRRKSTQDLMFEFQSGMLSRIKKILVLDFDVQIHNPSQTVETNSNDLDETKKRTYNFNVGRLLNFYEAFALGIKNKTLDEEICYDYKRKIIESTYRWCEPTIVARQASDPRSWIEFKRLNERWKKRHDKEIEDSGVKAPVKT